MNEHLGYQPGESEGRNRCNSRNGKRAKTVITDNAGPVQIEVPRDREASFEPVIVRKRQRRLTDLDQVVLSLSAKGLTTGEISAHLGEVYGAEVPKDTVTRITDRVIEEMTAWWARPLEQVYAAVFIDAIMVKVRDGQVRNRPVYAAIGVDLGGHKDIFGMLAGDGDGESAKFWYAVLNDLKSRGVRDVFFVVCDGLKGLPDSVNAVFPLATVQTCIIHLIRGTFRYASRRYWDELAKDLKPVYTAPDRGSRRDRPGGSGRQMRRPVPSRSAGCGAGPGRSSCPSKDDDVEIRRVICSTNAIESLNARFRRAVRARGHFPNEQSAMKTLYLVVRSLDPRAPVRHDGSHGGSRR